MKELTIGGAEKHCWSSSCYTGDLVGLDLVDKSGSFNRQGVCASLQYVGLSKGSLAVLSQHQGK